MIGYVYMITSPSNRIYIGSTKNTEKRWAFYYSLNCKLQIKLYNSLLKYGPENHIFEVVWFGDIEDMLRYECIIGNWYEVLGSKIGLNCKLPKHSDIYSTVSDDTRQKMIVSGKKRIITDETRDRLLKSIIGIVPSKKSRDKCSVSNTGKVRSDESKKNDKILD
tara:strand:+ start:5218 stop:5709 length:492 start_codon:yes stop_codon:yes gene_type:complete